MSAAKKADKNFLREMQKRVEELVSGKVKSITLNDLESGARRSYRIKKFKKQ